MKRLYLLLFLCFLFITTACSRRGAGSLSPDAPADAVPALEGDYVVNGFDPLGTEYSGVLTIFPTHTSGEYTMQWIIVGNIQQGQGLLNGNTLNVEWYSLVDVNNTSDTIYGTALYTITINGELYGTRTVDGHSNVGSEIAYPNK